MGRYRINTLVTIASVFTAFEIVNVNAFSPVGISQVGIKSQHSHFLTNGISTILNLSVPDSPSKSSPSKRVKSAPSTTDVQERFSTQLPSITPADEETPSSSPITPSDSDSVKRNLLAAAALAVAITLLSSSNLPSPTTTLTTSLSLLSTKIASTGFYQSFSLVLISEIGDKTFFIAGLLAMKSGRLLSFIGSIGALAVMTVLSVVIGQLFHSVPTEITQGIPIDDIAAVLAFTFFGVKTLIEASECDDGEDGCGVESELADAEDAVEGSRMAVEASTWAKIVTTFGLVFAAEFGDRSFFSTIALSAAQNPVSVAAGSIAAHAVATGLAVTGGSYAAKYISERTIGYIGGSLFLIFAFTTAFGLF